MHRDDHVGWDIGHGGVDQLAVKHADLVRVVAALLGGLAILRVTEHGDVDLVELQVAAAGIRERTHGFAIRLPEIGEEFIELRIDRLAHGLAAGAAIGRRWRRNGDFGRSRRAFLHELEMLDHRMAREADLADDARALGPRLHARERDPLVHHVALETSEAPEKIEMPPGAAELAVGDRLQAHRLLLLDQPLDLAVFDRFELGRRDLALLALPARLFQRSRAQQAADVIGAERWLGPSHACSCSARSFHRARPDGMFLARILDALDLADLLLMQLATRTHHHFGEILVHHDVARHLVEHDRPTRALEPPALERIERLVGLDLALERLHDVNDRRHAVVATYRREIGNGVGAIRLLPGRG